MLKACWDCWTGSGVENGRGDGVYGTQLNGGSESVPLRPVRSTERNMFVIPRALGNGDSLEVSCTINDPNRFTANLLTGSPRPDNNNIACQIDSDFQRNEIAVRVIENGQQAIPESDQIKGEANGMMSGSSDVLLEFKFEGGYGRTTLEMCINRSFLDILELKHDVEKITFLEMLGDVKVTGLNFKFA
ncbi:uncharacterized protein LOC133520669 isoform X1 [Cydia pomonella]|uniref:uncharacterized protein LOC133520669 isoform X1 n=1 Tax=Cydia pomonella TaxID=82600 RepID=UPI002ADE6A39|nr:uncharacterized protein LOC133520669 isoform X1 [Cydia pomonella]